MINEPTHKLFRVKQTGPSWTWTYGSWISNYICTQCLWPLKLWVRILLRQGVLDTVLCDEVWLAAGRWFSPGTPVSSTNKTDRHDITGISLKVALITITHNPNTEWKIFIDDNRVIRTWVEDIIFTKLFMVIIWVFLKLAPQMFWADCKTFIVCYLHLSHFNQKYSLVSIPYLQG